MYTAAIMKTELEASKGTRKLDMRIDNKLLLPCRRIFHRLMIFVQREVIEKLWQPMWYCSL